MFDWNLEFGNQKLIATLKQTVKSSHHQIDLIIHYLLGCWSITGLFVTSPPGILK
jgi:hypothetical protein